MESSIRILQQNGEDRESALLATITNVINLSLSTRNSVCFHVNKYSVA